ncbi:sodium ABC transporter ATP-binding protein [Aneurinibacillus migulanus]|uniref:ABC-2 type transport system ATP-binding protein n=1 Tax=Aneurinibacillus migulanus TaxID=47500 RepID=A0A0D1V031_ANEMI|nr:ABC transporter ATP-binding protein [Aneurinibacillus migulanus]KIV50153.1 sodium ABC transporter ATP-binding protein [Aneurinibacillus migulanus]KIV52644.1 sodium ABC transporter ATP-binding protein [Aneurinibacillus migulanus]KON96185.1 sodium ABC transporter ATP-binding protein [Aneurinibacillus migulanus]KPD04693.1 sodium ABC transporter ATP-binding protein [Aneurinibacillus migulanus]MED0894534.1 ABC transporter ATP-binding protein [Aneurinibacillus migulanus]
MENVIELKHVNKSFGDFHLKDISMTVKKGFITGFIGGNGAGKSTTIKLIMNLLQPDSGSISIFGLDYKEHEKEIKQRIGFVFDENIFYEHLTLAEMKRIIRPSYINWDESLFNHYIKKFELPLNKKIQSFSKGMMMKASLTIALSHHAELIIMDEPTSGLDPIFRRELLDILHNIMQDGKKTIFFSTHITTDLDRIADYITFIHKGQHIFTKKSYQIEEEYAIVKGGMELLDQDTEQEFISIRKSNAGFEALTSNKARIEDVFGDLVLIEKPTIEELMFYIKRGAE